MRYDAYACAFQAGLRVTLAGACNGNPGRGWGFGIGFPYRVVLLAVLESQAVSCQACEGHPRSRPLGEQRSHRVKRLWGDPVVGPASALVTSDEAGRQQGLQMVADRPLRESERFDEMADARLTVRLCLD